MPILLAVKFSSDSKSGNTVAVGYFVISKLKTLYLLFVRIQWKLMNMTCLADFNVIRVYSQSNTVIIYYISI